MNLQVATHLPFSEKNTSVEKLPVLLLCSIKETQIFCATMHGDTDISQQERAIFVTVWLHE